MKKNDSNPERQLLNSGVVRQGNFVCGGIPRGWHLESKIISEGKLEVKEDGEIYIDGVLDQELTSERKRAIAVRNREE